MRGAIRRYPNIQIYDDKITNDGTRSMTDRRKRRWLFAASLLLLLALTALALRRQPKIYSNEARVLDAEAISGLLDSRQEAGTEDDEKSG